ncbi:ATP-binding protein [Streptomyces sp. Act143]|uniref:ATP-binding protein n=1 Tax=Streptomyces sp. Act143 TaxID=2200760 RepID=UPI000D677C26|nr:ATP-binding protein [Streptomyces sp. Act143]PWI12597.1 ATP-binding protein [Streptomyces sp. Act143]
MRTDLAYGRLPDEREDHFLGLEAAHLVGTEALLTTRDNIEAVIEAKAMMCAYGPAGYGKTMAVNSALRALAPDITYRLELRSGPTPRDIRHGLFKALRLPGEPPKRPIEFDALLKNVLAEQFRVLVCDEAQWMSRTGFEFWRHLWDDRHTDIAVVFAGGDNCHRLRSRPTPPRMRSHRHSQYRARQSLTYPRRRRRVPGPPSPSSTAVIADEPYQRRHLRRSKFATAIP